MPPSLAAITLFVPLVAFLLAGASEFKASRVSGRKPWSLTPVAIAVADFAALLAPGGLFSDDLPHGLNALSRTMRFVSLAIAGSGLFVRYSRRRNGLIMAGGALLLAAIWFSNRIIA
jgi:hypothetical protein